MDRPRDPGTVTLLRSEIRRGTGGVVLAISGPLDVDTAAEARRPIEEKLSPAPVTALVVDARNQGLAEIMAEFQTDLRTALAAGASGSARR